MGKRTFDFDWITGLLLILLTSFGLFLLLTIDQSLFLQQLFYVAIGVIIVYLFSRPDPEIYWWFAPWGYLFSILLLLLTYLGPSIRGATRWLVVGGIQLQPSELVKPLLLLAFSRFITQYPPRKFANIILLMGLFLIPLVLVFRQPDIGSSIIYASFWLAMMLAGGLSPALVLVAAVSISLLFPVFWQHLAGYQKARIFTFLSPGLDPKGAGYNALQSMIAVGSGQLFGRGLGRGTQSHLRFLPEHHTDFIFATLVEELGFLGGLVLLTGYGLLLWRLLRPQLRGWVDTLFPFVYNLGLFAIIASQLFINAGMNMGIVPITGITLPFVSYGGSSILSLSASFGIWWGLARSLRRVALGPLD